MQDKIRKFLIDALGEEKAKKKCPDAWVQLLGIITCILITVAIVALTVAKYFDNSVESYTLILVLVLIANFFLKPKLQANKEPFNQIDLWISLLLIIATILVGIHLSNILQTLGKWEWVDRTVYLVGIGIILEGTRRTIDSKQDKKSWVFIGIVWGLVIVYLAGFGNSNLFFNPDKGIFSTAGIYGPALEIAIVVVYALLLFRFAFPLITTGKLVDYLAFKVTHGRRSGASSALYTIWVSTFYGAISGAARGNLAESGKNTILVMRQAGYPAEFSASVGATASAMGQLVPPMMGMVGFIIVAISDLSYLDVMLATLIPSFLIILSLIVAVILEARRLELQPLKLQDTVGQIEIHKEMNKELWFQAIALILSFCTFFVMLIIGFSPSFCALSATSVIVSMIFFWPPSKDYRTRLLGFVIRIGRGGLNIALSCATIGIILFIFKQTGAQQWMIDNIVYLLNLDRIGWLVKLAVLFILAILPMIANLRLPAPAVFLMMVFLMVPLLKAIGIPELHAYLFVFFYSVLAGIISFLYIPLLLKQVTKIIQGVERKKLYQMTARLSVVAFILPLVWIYHPEIILDTNTIFDFSHLTKTVYVVLAFSLAIVALSVAYFGFSRKPKNLLSLSHYGLLFISGILIIFPNMISMIIGVIVAIYILIHNDLKARHNSILRQAFILVRLIITPKNINFSVWLIFVILVLVYTAFFTTSGFVVYLNNQSVAHWLKERFHFTLAVTDCNAEVNNLKEFLHQKNYDSTVICSRFAEVSATKIYPGEVRLQTKVKTVEFNEVYFQVVPQLKTSLQNNFKEAIFPPLSSCWAKTGVLEQYHFNLNQFKLTECYHKKTLPPIYLGSELSELLEASTGSTLHLHDSMFVETLHQDIQNNPKQNFVVASVFDTKFPDLNQFMIGPTKFLSNIFSVENGTIEYKLIVKINNLKSLEELKTILTLLEELKEPHSLLKLLKYKMDYSIIDHEIWKIQGEFLKGIQAIYFVIGFICFWILLSGISQLIENNRKSVNLMRLSGVQLKVLWMFLFILSIIGATIPCVLGYLLSMFFALFFENIAYMVGLSIFLTFFGLTLLAAIFITFILSKVHFLRDLAKELDDV